MVRHTVDGEQFLPVTGNNTRDVFVKFFFSFRANEILAALNGEDHLDVNLRIGICHDFHLCKDVAPTELDLLRLAINMMLLRSNKIL